MTTINTTVLPPMTADDLDGDWHNITPLAVTCGEDGGWIGWGHIDVTVFAEAVVALDAYLDVITLPLTEDDTRAYGPAQVRHCWMVATRINEDGEWWGRYVKAGTPGCWPVTELVPA